MSEEPFNVKLLQVDKNRVAPLMPIGTLDIFKSRDHGELHPQGLFSTEIFGEFGSEERDKTFSYIRLKTQILHPIIYQRLKRVKRFYIDILSGRRYARFDSETKDFVEAKRGEGETGFAFFMRHFSELEIPKGNSETRRQRVALIDHYRKIALTPYVLVMPAGLRDAEVTDEGTVEEDEINPHYRRLMSIANTIEETSQWDDPALDSARFSQQQVFNTIYQYIEDTLSGKSGFIQERWGARRVFNGTRNVISALDIASPTLGRTDYPGPDDTVMGLWQLSRGALPITIHALRQNMLSDVFGDVEGSARLVNPETYKAEWVSISSASYDRWASKEGLEKVIGLQGSTDMRARPVTVEGYYLALVYKPKNWHVFKVFHSVDEMPENYSVDDVHPITYMELIYLANYRNWNDLRAIITRYPVSGEGSTYPSKVFVRTTVDSEERVELDDNWQPMAPEEENTAIVYPIFEPLSFIDSTMVHTSRLGGLGGD